MVMSRHWRHFLTHSRYTQCCNCYQMKRVGKWQLFTDSFMCLALCLGIYQQSPREFMHRHMCYPVFYVPLLTISLEINVQHILENCCSGCLSQFSLGYINIKQLASVYFSSHLLYKIVVEIILKKEEKKRNSVKYLNVLKTCR